MFDYNILRFKIVPINPLLSCAFVWSIVANARVIAIRVARHNDALEIVMFRFDLLQPNVLMVTNDEYYTRNACYDLLKRKCLHLYMIYAKCFHN